MRLFFALQFDEKTVEAITAVQGRLAQAAQNVRLSQRENLHLTLAFWASSLRALCPGSRQLWSRRPGNRWSSV